MGHGCELGVREAASIAFGLCLCIPVGAYFRKLSCARCLLMVRVPPGMGNPSPGVAMAFLAVAAISWQLGARTPRASKEWFGVANYFSFVCGEMHSIADERKIRSRASERRSREETTQREQTRSFTQLIADGQHLFKALAEEKGWNRENLEHILAATYIVGSYRYSSPVGLGRPRIRNNWWQLG